MFLVTLSTIELKIFNSISGDHELIPHILLHILFYLIIIYTMTIQLSTPVKYITSIVLTVLFTVGTMYAVDIINLWQTAITGDKITPAWVNSVNTAVNAASTPTYIQWWLYGSICSVQYDDSGYILSAWVVNPLANWSNSNYTTTIIYPLTGCTWGYHYLSLNCAAWFTPVVLNGIQITSGWFKNIQCMKS